MAVSITDISDFHPESAGNGLSICSQFLPYRGGVGGREQTSGINKLTTTCACLKDQIWFDTVAMSVISFSNATPSLKVIYFSATCIKERFQSRDSQEQYTNFMETSL